MIAAATGILMHQKGDKPNQALETLRKKKWATSIRSLLDDDFELEDEYATLKITVEDALSHRTGLSGADNMYGPWMGKDPKAVVKALRHLGALNEPFRGVYQYNNLMYSVVGDCLKSTTGLDAGAVLRNLLWDPLGMKSTYWTLDKIPREQRQGLARGYYWVDTPASSTPGLTGCYVPEPYIDLACIASAGAVISSVTDYAKWITELLAAASRSDEDDSGNHLISAELFNELVTPRTFIFEPSVGERLAQLSPSMYALGWIIYPPAAGVKHPIISHGGGLNGFGTQIYLLPSDNFGVVTLTNTVLWGNVVGDLISLELIARKLGLDGDVKTDFIKTMKLKLPPKPAADGDINAAKTDIVEPTRPEIERVNRLLQTVLGEYRHPAWGLFQISQYEPDKQSRPIPSMPWVGDADHRERDNRRSKIPCLRVSPVGKRTWKYELLLHPRLDSVLFDSTNSASDIADDTEDQWIFFDLEALGGHGNVEDDAIAGFDTGCARAQKNDLLRAERVWHSQSWSQYGAALKMSSDHITSASSHKDHSSQPCSLGMRLATAHIGTDGSPAEGWDAKMTWFTKVEPNV
jgi:CubicO group peptidase (beta-lactamase class C family)